MIDLWACQSVICNNYDIITHTVIPYPHYPNVVILTTNLTFILPLIKLSAQYKLSESLKHFF